MRVSQLLWRHFLREEFRKTPGFLCKTDSCEKNSFHSAQKSCIFRQVTGGFTHHPDEEGTESARSKSRQHCRRIRFTHHPDEEGTERLNKSDTVFPRCCFTHHPDEEGTESLTFCVVVIVKLFASHTIPMKRKLKAMQSRPT